ncbi:MAG: response regulator [Candidatus Omnitrophica bacterium]|nr:response regulator [Candidatus Omnitrophota bacterium]
MAKKILVVDDEWAILELLRVKLTKCGYEVCTARNEKEFRQLALEQKPNLLILDIWLGSDGEGTQVYDKVIHDGFDPKVPVIFISALVDEGTPPRRVQDGGKFALYGKPFDFDLLFEDIRKLIG